jgi:GT2 family glycosyltransferase
MDKSGKLSGNSKEMDAQASRQDTELKDVDENRVVMRHRIALNLDEFRAIPDGFEARQSRDDGDLVESTAPFFSVVIPNYNGVHLLPGVRDALERQVFQDFEVIVIDDASSDGSVPWVEDNWPEARLIVNRRNEGFDKSCNTAAAAARGRVLVFLNSDAQPEPDWSSELALAVCSHPGAGIFASKVLLMDRPDTLHTTGDMLGINGMPVNRGVWEKDLNQYDDFPEVFGGSGCALAVRLELWDTLGGFDESLWMYLEDVDFAFRSQLLGIRSVYVPKARVHHALTATAGGTLSSYYVGRNTIWVIAKNMPAGILAQNWQRIFAAQLQVATDGLRNLRGAEARARLAGQVIGVLTLPRVLAKRRVVQQRRRISDETLRERLHG